MPYFALADIRLYYEIHGEGEPVLLIHGLGSSVRDWEQQIPFLKERFQVIAFDVRGHGRSDKPPGPYSVPQFAADAAALVQGLGYESVHVVGISMGGMIAFQLAADFPACVRSLVVVNSAPELPVRSFADRLRFWQREWIVRLLGMRKMGEVLSRRLFIKPEQGELRRLFVERWAQNDPRAYLAAMRALVGWSVMPRLGEITVPVLFLASDEDYTFIGDKQAYVEKMKNARLEVITDARHALPVERPEEFNRSVLAFLQEVGSA